jgi:hypothetical protein
LKFEPRTFHGLRDETSRFGGRAMSRAAAIAMAAALGAGLATAYLARERVTTVSSRRDEVAPAPATTPLPAPGAASGAPPRAESTPFGGEDPRSASDLAPAATPPTATGAGDRREPGAQVFGEHDDDFANRYVQVAERFRGERRDPTAALPLEREILDRFAALTGLEVTTLDVECRSTTCRVRMAERPREESRPLQGPGGFQNLVTGFGTVVSTVSEAEDGSTVFEWLLARDPPAEK